MSGGSVAEGVVSGSSVDGQKSAESTGKGISGKFCTDTNLYFDDGVMGVVQTRLDGTHVREIELKDYFYLLGVADGWLYYGIDDESDASVIGRVPIRKENGYDRVETDRVERLVEVEDPGYIVPTECLAGDSLYYVYCSGFAENSARNGIMERIDLKTGERDSRQKVHWKPGGLLIEAGERVYAVPGGTELYTNRSNESGWTILDAGRKIDTERSIWGCTEKAFYYHKYDDTGTSTSGLCRIDAETGEDTLFLSVESICGAVRNSRGFEEENELSVRIDSVYNDEGRLWILAQIKWVENGVYHVEYQVFSQGEEETGLRYEEELTGCMHDHGSVRTGKWVITEDGKETIVKEHMEIDESLLYAVESGRAFMALYDGEKKKYRVGYYEIETGEFHWLTNRDPIFYGPAVSGRYQLGSNWAFNSLYSREPYRKNGLWTDEADDQVRCDLVFVPDFDEGCFVEN